MFNGTAAKNYLGTGAEPMAGFTIIAQDKSSSFANKHMAWPKLVLAFCLRVTAWVSKIVVARSLVNIHEQSLEIGDGF